MRRIFNELKRNLQQLKPKWVGRFTNLFSAVQETVLEQKDLGKLDDALRDNLRMAHFENFAASATAQSKLLGVTRASSLTLRKGVARAKAFQGIAQERILQVLGKNAIALESYAEIVEAELSMTAINEGFIVASIAEGATHKQFVRIGKSTVERSHSSLEGKIIPVGNNFEMDGYSVPFPHHPSLPLKHRINCKHAVVGLRLKRQGQDRGIISDFEAYFAKLK